jgi:hypothetical protein
MIYRVPSRIDDGTHYGYTYHTNKKDAWKQWKLSYLEKCEDTGKTLCLSPDYQTHANTSYWKKGTGFDPFDDDCVMDGIESMPTPKNQAEVLYMLRIWAWHPDNG